MSAHRLFPLNGDDLCDEPAGTHRPGDRHVGADGVVVDELTGTGTWTKVCPECDKAMIGRDPEGWLACEDCGIRAHEVSR